MNEKKCAQSLKKYYIFPNIILYASTFGLPDKEDNLEVKCHGFTVRLVNSENDVRLFPPAVRNYR